MHDHATNLSNQSRSRSRDEVRKEYSTLCKSAEEAMERREEFGKAFEKFMKFYSWSQSALESTSGSAGEKTTDSGTGDGSQSSTGEGIKDPPEASVDIAPSQSIAAKYLSTSRQFSKEKSQFRYILKKSAQETKVWGAKTIKELTPAQLNHILTRVKAKCPALEGHEQAVDKALGKSLREAKYYTKKRNRQGGSHGKDQHASGSKHGTEASGSKKNPKKASSPKKISSTKHPVMGKSGKACPKKGSHSCVEKGKFPLSPVSPQHKSDSSDEESTYEERVAARRLVTKKMMKSLKSSTVSGDFKTGQPIVLLVSGEQVATGEFIQYLDEMFLEAAFQEHLLENPKEELEDVCLPVAVPACPLTGRKQKVLFCELEADDIFTWKIERTALNDPVGGYCYGTQKASESAAALDGKRRPKPNHRYVQK